MGRVKHYTRHSNKKRHQKGQSKNDDYNDLIEETKQEVITAGKKKQIFKKGRAKEIKAKIKELKVQSLKLKKKNLEQKSQKKKIAKEIHRLKASLKACEEVPKEGSDEDEEMKVEKTTLD